MRCDLVNEKTFFEDIDQESEACVDPLPTVLESLEIIKNHIQLTTESLQCNKALTPVKTKHLLVEEVI